MLSLPLTAEEYKKATAVAYRSLMDDYSCKRIGMTIPEYIGWPRNFQEPWDLKDRVPVDMWKTLSDKALAYARLVCLSSLASMSSPEFQEILDEEQIKRFQKEANHLVNNEAGIAKEISHRKERTSPKTSASG